VFERVRAWWQQRVDATIRREHACVLADPRHLSRHRRVESVAWSAAVAVHLMTAGLVVLAVLVGLSGVAALVKVLAIVLLVALAAVVARARVPRPLPGWSRDQAPAVFAVIDEVAAALGARAPARVIVTADLDAVVTGHRPRAVLAIGLPAWAALSAAGRAALIARALVAGTDGGVGRSPVVSAAHGSLREWRYLLVPNTQAPRRRSPRRRAGGRATSSVGIAELVVPVVLAPVYLLTVVLEWLLAASTLSATQRAGYRAVLRAGAVAGPDGVRDLVRMQVMRARIDSEWEVALRRAPDSDLVDLPRDYLAALDDTIVGVVSANARDATLSRVDGGPPPVFLADVVAAAPADAPSRVVAVDAARLAAADAELERARPEVRRDLRAHLQEKRARTMAVQSNDYPR
jgi:hypothetical protein